MLSLCDETWESDIIKYIAEDYSKCLYLYINLHKYGLNNDNFKVWVSLNTKGQIVSIISRYYTGVNVFSKKNDYSVEDVLEIINRYQPSIITGVRDTIKEILPNLKNYKAEYGSIGVVSKGISCETNKVEIATSHEMEEIAKLLIEDDGLGSHYEISILEKQLKERLLLGFGRNYIIKNNNKIVSHCATYAEMDKIAVTSGVYTQPDKRGNGYAFRTYSKLCSDLLKEGKEIYAYYYTFPAHRMHEKVGFRVISDWAKLIKTN